MVIFRIRVVSRAGCRQGTGWAGSALQREAACVEVSIRILEFKSV
jgi:hypothetical protein